MLWKRRPPIWKLLAGPGSILGTYCSFAGLLGLEGGLWTGWKTPLFLLATVFAIIGAFVSTRDIFAAQPCRLETPREIRDYMFEWISVGGHTAILTRDMSWVDDDEMKTLLAEKARKGELTILLPKDTEFSETLKKQGASIVTFSHLGYVPKSRFTIINRGRHDARVAVGGRYDGRLHEIKEYSNGAHPFFALADDVVCLLEGLNYGQGQS